MIRVTVHVHRWLDKKTFDDAVKDRARVISRRLFEGVVVRSPVETGSFRSSWRVAFNVVDKSITDGGAPGTPLPPPEFYWPIGFHVGDMVHISNSQPYAVRLEYGWSKQAPLGIVRVTVASMKAFAQ